MTKIAVLSAAAAAWLAMTAPVMAEEGNPAEGEKIFKRSCGSCHIASEDGPRRMGPPLFGVIGREAGSLEGYNYSAASEKSNVTWTPETLDKYLADPRKFMPGTKMAFAGLKKDDQRADVIAYLRSLK